VAKNGKGHDDWYVTANWLPSAVTGAGSYYVNTASTSPTTITMGQAVTTYYSYLLQVNRNPLPQVDTPEVREAEAKALWLLLEHLNEEQRADFEATRSFVVVVEASKRRYRIREHVTHNIRELDADGVEFREYCMVFREDRIPLHDLLTAQKLLLESDEEVFINSCNMWLVEDGQRVEHRGKRPSLLLKQSYRPTAAMPLQPV
jgi:hypothetical protein